MIHLYPWYVLIVRRGHSTWYYSSSFRYFSAVDNADTSPGFERRSVYFFFSASYQKRSLGTGWSSYGATSADRCLFSVHGSRYGFWRKTGQKRLLIIQSA